MKIEKRTNLSLANLRWQRILSVAALWLCLLGALGYGLEMSSRRDEKLHALSIARAFFQQVVISRLWNASHGGVYVPITKDTQPNAYLPLENRDLTADNGLKLTKINPAYMTRQMAELAEINGEGIHFHTTSLRPIRPGNAPTDWEARWLRSFEQGVKEQGEFFADGKITWFRYMAPLKVTKACLVCHARQGYQEGDIRGGISVSLPYPTHRHLGLLMACGALACIGLLGIFIGGVAFERKKLLFDATFDSANPVCVTGGNYTILVANHAYWQMFGSHQHPGRPLKCYDHRPGTSCHTEKCLLAQVMAGGGEVACETGKEKFGEIRYCIVTGKPLLDARGEVVGIVESYQDITDRKRLEDEKVGLITALEKSLEQVKLLSGIIPICSSCKKIRDDQGYWGQVESYISKHSEAQFSHGICPDCIKKLYPDICDEILATPGTPPEIGEREKLP